ncbi:MAG TPA: nucleotidyltransferase domain-containing protein [Mobilitalea sp.]|nr:nucleotidyltransferase domain-containing protein [Mobilitalea sp.]
MLQSIEIMKTHILEIILENDPSIYLFGSVVLDDFKLGWSDIDILCLTKTPLSENQTERLVYLRQELLEKYPANPYFRSFEGGFLTLSDFLNKTPSRVVYWGTSGQRITDQYYFDVFSTMELMDSGRLIYGENILEQLTYPSQEEVQAAVLQHYHTIRRYALITGRSLYSAGWLLDIARCLYTLQTGKIIAKTVAGEWALEQSYIPDKQILKKAVEIRKNPIQYKNDESIQEWLERLGPYIQQYADVLEEQLNHYHILQPQEERRL